MQYLMSLYIVAQWLKSIEFKLPIIEKEFTLSLDNDMQNEVCILQKVNQMPTLPKYG